ncbi:hypothetical protein ACFQY7_10650 [Actinomadura luteofluorescens]|uniref:hypothetical protein n=1 Tax=Actinomadura luteofluorescens TaxID=46163 RepID=UPI003627C034
MSPWRGRSRSGAIVRTPGRVSRAHWHSALPAPASVNTVAPAACTARRASGSRTGLTMQSAMARCRSSSSR